MADIFPTQDLFHFNDEQESFEDFGHENGYRYWYARDLMKMLGYQSYDSFKKAINKAMASCATLNISIMDNFIQDSREIDGKTHEDYKLSKFACYLTVMNGDVSKTKVAKAQAYFATLADAVQRYIKESEDIERVLVRDEISEHEKTLSSTAKQAGVQHYGMFKDNGYMGLYNMSLRKLKKVKGIPDKRTPLDFMGKTELAANLFRITQTEEKIKKESLRGQKSLENTAYNVGRTVRNTMKQLSGTKPEDLPVKQDIKKVKSDLKKTHKEFQKDKSKQIKSKDD